MTSSSQDKLLPDSQKLEKLSAHNKIDETSEDEMKETKQFKKKAPLPSNTDRTVAAPSQLKNQHINVAKKPALNVLSPKGTVTQVQAQLAKD